MATLWPSLYKMENSMMLKIVMGEESVSSFDSFVERWRSAGGDQIISEVEAEIGK